MYIAQAVDALEMFGLAYFEDGSMVSLIICATFLLSGDGHPYISDFGSNSRVPEFDPKPSPSMFVQSLITQITQLLPRCTGSRTYPAAT